MRELLTVEEAAAELRLSYKTTLDLCKKGELPARQIGASWRVDAALMRSMWTDDLRVPTAAE